MQEQIVLALIGFALGMAATVLTQSLFRRWKYADARRKRKVEGLRRIREWVESYRILLQCKYPELPELILAHEKLKPDSPNFDKTAPKRVYQALIEYRSSSELETIIHPWLKYYLGHSDYRDREINMFDAMSNLPYYRHKAKRAIEEVLVEVHRREEEWLIPDGS